jgi:hypothetical protein
MPHPIWKPSRRPSTITEPRFVETGYRGARSRRAFPRSDPPATPPELPIMGMTIWIHTLEDREYSKDSEDHSLMNRHAEALDTLCDEVGVRKLSEFMDYTDQEFEYDGFDDEDDDGEPELDPETELAYGIDDMTWFDAAEGLVSLQALRDAVVAQGLPGLDEDEAQELIAELDDCISALDGPASRGGKFHLSLVE